MPLNSFISSELDQQKIISIVSELIHSNNSTQISCINKLFALIPYDFDFFYYQAVESLSNNNIKLLEHILDYININEAGYNFILIDERKIIRKSIIPVMSARTDITDITDKTKIKEENMDENRPVASINSVMFIEQLAIDADMEMESTEHPHRRDIENDKPLIPPLRLYNINPIAPPIVRTRELDNFDDLFDDLVISARSMSMSGL